MIRQPSSKLDVGPGRIESRIDFRCGFQGEHLGARLVRFRDDRIRAGTRGGRADPDHRVTVAAGVHGQKGLQVAGVGTRGVLEIHHIIRSSRQGRSRSATVLDVHPGAGAVDPFTRMSGTDPDSGLRLHHPDGSQAEPGSQGRQESAAWRTGPCDGNPEINGCRGLFSKP